MVFQPASGNGAIESPTIEITQEGLRSLLNQIETQLLDSEVYHRTMAGLQTILGEASSTAQILVKAVGREAVRLTFQQFVKQYNIVPIASEEANQVTDKQLDSIQTLEDSFAMAESQEHSTSVENITDAEEATGLSSLASRPIGETKPPKKLSKAEMAAQKAAREREDLLRQVGRELRQAREERSLSISQLHRQTLVPAHQIEALEAGRIEELPEDVYVRGFIRRIANALGLNGLAIAASVPEPDPVKSVVPSWYHATGTPLAGFQLTSVHLYLGYTALIAGAVGGLSWMSRQVAPGTSVKTEPTPASQTSMSPKATREATTSKPVAPIAPPESSTF